MEYSFRESLEGADTRVRPTARPTQADGRALDPVGATGGASGRRIRAGVAVRALETAAAVRVDDARACDFYDGRRDRARGYEAWSGAGKG